MSEGILVLNAGSSSIKFAVYADAPSGPVEAAHGLIEDIGGAKPHFVAKAPDGTKLHEALPAPEPKYDHARALGDLLDSVSGKVGGKPAKAGAKPGAPAGAPTGAPPAGAAGKQAPGANAQLPPGAK